MFGSTHDVTSNLQRLQNNAARVILRISKSAIINIHLGSPHWLPVKERSTYKIACMCYHYHRSTAPSYVTDIPQKKSPKVEIGIENLLTVNDDEVRVPNIFLKQIDLSKKSSQSATIPTNSKNSLLSRKVVIF